MNLFYNINHDISFESIQPIIDELKDLDRSETTIMIQIHSNGGIVEAAFQLADLLSEFTNTVAFTDRCCSAATIIFLSCKARLVAQECIFLIHRPLLNIEGNADDHYLAANILDVIEQSIVEYYSKFSTPESFIHYMIAEQLLDNDTLLKLNFATGVL